MTYWIEDGFGNAISEGWQDQDRCLAYARHLSQVRDETFYVRGSDGFEWGTDDDNEQ